MENHKQASQTSTNSGMGMYEFFYEEFQTLRARTGIRQWENLNELPSTAAAKAIHDVIDFMCKECEKPPFDVVQMKVKQRVISRAVVEDQDFIGLNAKFVRKALNAWWLTNGDRVIQAMNEASKPDEPVDLTEEQKRKIDKLLDGYRAHLLQGDGPQSVPKIDKETAVIEGAEWKSDIERKAILHPSTPKEEVFRINLHREYCIQNFDPITQAKLSTWKPEQEWNDSLSKEEKEKIYNRK